LLININKKDRIALMDKKLLIILFLICVFNLTAQENTPQEFQKKTAFTYGVDVNMNSPTGLAYGAILGIEFYLPERSSFGIQLTASSDGASNNVIEPLLAFRYYFTDLHNLYLQLDTGASFITEIGETRFNLLIGLKAGYKFNVGKIFFIEPFIRGGFPFIAGGGLVLGYKY